MNTTPMVVLSEVKPLTKVYNTNKSMTYPNANIESIIKQVKQHLHMKFRIMLTNMIMLMSCM
jgi:hypothetical protein